MSSEPKNNRRHAEELLEKASKASTGGEAMAYSQAACNAANAARVLAELDNK